MAMGKGGVSCAEGEEEGAEDEEQHDRIRNFRANAGEPIPWD